MDSEQRNQNRIVRRRKERDELIRICEKHDIALNFIAKWHFTLTKNDFSIDLFPEKKRYHDLMINKRGKYSNLVMFVKEKFAL